jgi:hypothetical protein
VIALLLIVLICVGLANLGVMVARLVGPPPVYDYAVDRVQSCRKYSEQGYAITLADGSRWRGYGNLWWSFETGDQAPADVNLRLRRAQRRLESGSV